MPVTIPSEYIQKQSLILNSKHTGYVHKVQESLPSSSTTTTTKPNSKKKKEPVSYMLMFKRSPSTRRQYPKRLKLFFNFIGLEGANEDEQALNFLEQARQGGGGGGADWATENIMMYLDHHRQRVLRKEITAGTLKTLWVPIRSFTDFYDDVLGDKIKWKRITGSMPKTKSHSNDRIPTLEELRKLVEYPDRRIKAIVYTMVSSGIRIGAWDYLKWKHITPIQNDKTGEIIAAKLIVYAEEPEEYFTFITPEAYKAIKDWMDYRALYGEQITGESWIMRKMFAVADLRRKTGGQNRGNTSKITNTKQLSNKALNRLLIRALYEQGPRETLEDGERRHEFKAAHGFRKYFKTRAEQVMNRLNGVFARAFDRS